MVVSLAPLLLLLLVDDAIGMIVIARVCVWNALGVVGVEGSLLIGDEGVGVGVWLCVRGLVVNERVVVMTRPLDQQAAVLQSLSARIDFAESRDFMRIFIDYSLSLLATLPSFIHSFTGAPAYKYLRPFGTTIQSSRSA